jgi:hypothetical protein
MFRANKLRIYSRPEQEELINNTFGCGRFVYDTLLTCADGFGKPKVPLKFLT